MFLTLLAPQGAEPPPEPPPVAPPARKRLFGGSAYMSAQARENADRAASIRLKDEEETLMMAAAILIAEIA